MGKTHKLNEIARTYTFPNGDRITIEQVRELQISASDNHRLVTEDGRLHVVRGNWIHIEIQSEKGWEL